MVGGGMHRDQGLEDREGVAVGAPGDQRVEAVLRCELLGGMSGRRPVNAAIPHSDGVRGVGGVPGLVGAVEVAETEMDDPHRCGGR